MPSHRGDNSGVAPVALIAVSATTSAPNEAWENPISFVPFSRQ
jgi:hypothetical protein